MLRRATVTNDAKLVTIVDSHTDNRGPIYASGVTSLLDAFDAFIEKGLLDVATPTLTPESRGFGGFESVAPST